MGCPEFGNPDGALSATGVDAVRHLSYMALLQFGRSLDIRERRGDRLALAFQIFRGEHGGDTTAGQDKSLDYSTLSEFLPRTDPLRPISAITGFVMCPRSGGQRVDGLMLAPDLVLIVRAVRFELSDRKE